MDEVKKWILQGWLFVQVLSADEAVIHRPSPLLNRFLALGVDHLKPNLALEETLSEGKIVGLQEDQFADRTV